MRIAVVDVAAESGGALSVLRDFLSYVDEINDEHNEYYVFVSREVDIQNPHIHYILKPGIKKSWISRLKWERFGAIKEMKQLEIDVVFSLQNTAFFSDKIRQIVYFHNVLLLEPRKKYSLWKKEERLFGIYVRVIAPYTLRSLRKAETIVCQTNTVKKEIQKKVPGINTIVVNPNVYVDDKYQGSAIRPIKGCIYPTAAVPFKHIEEVIECVRNNKEWFAKNEFEVLITVSGTENAYAQRIFESGKDIENIKFIGYQKRERILEFYRDHALMINSELESFPLPFKEAELVGTPVVAADYLYAKEILADVKGATVFEKHNATDMLRALKLAFEQGDNAVSIPEQTNSWSSVVQILSTIRNM